MIFTKITYYRRCDFPRLEPTEERFNSSVGKIIVRPDFMSEELRVKLLQKDSCRVWGTVEELAPTPFACAIFEAKCRYLFLESENSTLPVIAKKASVLSRLKVGLHLAFLPSPKKFINEALASV